MNATSLVVVILPLLAATGVSMSDRTIPGEIFDARVTACGVLLEDGAMARIRPFLETSAGLTGTLKVDVVKRSPSGTSMTSQSNAFRSGRSQANIVAVDRPSTVTITMEATAVDGTALCRLSRELKFGNDTTEL